MYDVKELFKEFNIDYIVKEHLFITGFKNFNEIVDINTGIIKVIIEKGKNLQIDYENNYYIKFENNRLKLFSNSVVEDFNMKELNYLTYFYCIQDNLIYLIVYIKFNKSDLCINFIDIDTYNKFYKQINMRFNTTKIESIIDEKIYTLISGYISDSYKISPYVSDIEQERNPIILTKNPIYNRLTNIGNNYRSLKYYCETNLNYMKQLNLELKNYYFDTKEFYNRSYSHIKNIDYFCKSDSYLTQYINNFTDIECILNILEKLYESVQSNNSLNISGLVSEYFGNNQGIIKCITDFYKKDLQPFKTELQRQQSSVLEKLNFNSYDTTIIPRLDITRENIDDFIIYEKTRVIDVINREYGEQFEDRINNQQLSEEDKRIKMTEFIQMRKIYDEYSYKRTINIPFIITPSNLYIYKIILNLLGPNYNTINSVLNVVKIQNEPDENRYGDYNPTTEISINGYNEYKTHVNTLLNINVKLLYKRTEYIFPGRSSETIPVRVYKCLFEFDNNDSFEPFNKDHNYTDYPILLKEFHGDKKWPQKVTLSKLVVSKFYHNITEFNFERFYNNSDIKFRKLHDKESNMINFYYNCYTILDTFSEQRFNQELKLFCYKVFDITTELSENDINQIYNEKLDKLLLQCLNTTTMQNFDQSIKTDIERKQNLLSILDEIKLLKINDSHILNYLKTTSSITTQDIDSIITDYNDVINKKFTNFSSNIQDRLSLQYRDTEIQTCIKAYEEIMNNKFYCISDRDFNKNMTEAIEIRSKRRINNKRERILSIQENKVVNAKRAEKFHKKQKSMPWKNRYWFFANARRDDRDKALYSWSLSTEHMNDNTIYNRLYPTNEKHDEHGRLITEFGNDPTSPNLVIFKYKQELLIYHYILKELSNLHCNIYSDYINEYNELTHMIKDKTDKTFTTELKEKIIENYKVQLEKYITSQYETFSKYLTKKTINIESELSQKQQEFLKYTIEKNKMKTQLSNKTKEKTNIITRLQKKKQDDYHNKRLESITSVMDEILTKTRTYYSLKIKKDIQENKLKIKSEINKHLNRQLISYKKTKKEEYKLTKNDSELNVLINKERKEIYNKYKRFYESFKKIDDNMLSSITDKIIKLELFR